MTATIIEQRVTDRQRARQFVNRADAEREVFKQLDDEERVFKSSAPATSATVVAADREAAEAAERAAELRNQRAAIVSILHRQRLALKTLREKISAVKKLHAPDTVLEQMGKEVLEAFVATWD